MLSIGQDVRLWCGSGYEKQVLSFGLKQRTPNPDDIEQKYPVGSVVEGKVVNITDYGAFIKIDEGIEGFCIYRRFHGREG